MKVKPKRDFATDKKLFIAGRYYTIDNSTAKKLHKQGKVWMQKVWYENSIKCTQYV